MSRAQHRAIDNGNGHILASHWYRPEGAPRGCALIAPAMGVEQRFYAAFAAWLAERGYLAVTFDYLGMGQSRSGPLRGLEVSVLDWARHDCSAMLAAALAEIGDRPLYWIGHSLGGQILPFVEGREHIARIFSIASGSGYWKENSVPLRNRVWLLWYVIAPLLTPLLGYFPGRRLGMVGDLPRGVIEQWRRWCLHPQYALADGEDIRRAFSTVRTPMVSLSFTDDEMMSRRSIESLLGFYREAPKTAWRIAPEEIGARHIGHFGFFRAQFAESLWAGYLLPELSSGNALSRG
ncbi:alpha/beta hydrolase family protein [Pseudomonas paraeruginosa]|uniref:alpha/beta hydrolase family protein n=1 Tax=Pseudomonas paraeruginosa TaxID=2994495 RepID=UPI003748F9A8